MSGDGREGTLPPVTAALAEAHDARPAAILALGFLCANEQTTGASSPQHGTRSDFAMRTASTARRNFLLTCTAGPRPINRSFDMNKKSLLHGLVIAAMTFGSFASDARAGDGPIVHEAGGLSYVSGGVGEESLQRLREQVSEFNLKLVFAMASGAFLSNVRVAIADGKGETLVEAISDGPWFLAKLPVGKYRVVATYAGKAIQRSVAVEATALNTVDFRWEHE